MSLILPNRYILDTIVPFWSTMNDDTIADSIKNTCDALMRWCEKGDQMMVVRGFRDVMESFINMGFELGMHQFRF